jgi:hypothetical protein
MSCQNMRKSPFNLCQILRKSPFVLFQILRKSPFMIICKEKTVPSVLSHQMNLNKIKPLIISESHWRRLFSSSTSRLPYFLTNGKSIRLSTVSDAILYLIIIIIYVYYAFGAKLTLSTLLSSAWKAPVFVTGLYFFHRLIP